MGVFLEFLKDFYVYNHFNIKKRMALYSYFYPSYFILLDWFWLNIVFKDPSS